MTDIVERLLLLKSAAAQSWAKEAAGEIKSLRQQLAASKKEVNQLNGMMRDKGFGQGEIDTMGWHEEQLEASQAREAKLRGYFEKVNEYTDARKPWLVYATVEEALAIPSDNTALPEAANSVENGLNEEFLRKKAEELK